MAALTLVEAAKAMENRFTRGVIETFIANQRLTQIVPYRDIVGGVDSQAQESVLPDADTRGVNEAFTRSQGRIDEILTALKIYGGDIGIDPFITATKGSVQAARNVQLKIKAVSNRWTTDFFKGDASANARDFDGLQNRLSGFNLESAGSGAGGSQLSLAILDESILKCHNPQFLLMGRRMAVLLSQAARDSTTSGSVVRVEMNSFGRRAMFYQDLEIVVVTDNSNNDNILGFTEAATGGGGNTASSIYIAGMGDEGVEGIQNGGFRTRNLGEDNATPREDTRVEWYNNFVLNHPRCAIRLRDIANSAFLG